jgi:tRNA modification GTPase
VYHSDDTIAAIATAPGGAARGIVRTSGPATIAILERCFQPRDAVALREVRAATVLSGTVLCGTIEPVGSRSRGLPADVYLWPGARSYTRQSVAEIHTIGSPPLLSAVLTAVCAAGARLAEPGEFTLRAFLAGRVDLTQAEAVLGIIDARGEQQFERALAQLAGGLARPLGELRDALLDLLAEIETGLDFVEEDIQFITREQIQLRIDQALQVIARLSAQLAARRSCDERPRAVLVGCPNVGKSSLFNALTARAGALVSDEPGTTRDYLTALLDFGSIGCQLIDTAGADSSGVGDGISSLAGQLSASQEQGCDIRLLCIDSSRPLNEWERRELVANHFTRQIVVLTKCDKARRVELPQGAAVETSAATARGLEELRHRLGAVAAEVRQSDSAGGLTAERCDESLRTAAASLDRAGRLSSSKAGDELIAAELRVTLVQLGKVVGAVYTDDILDRVFSRFCIGK